MQTEMRQQDELKKNQKVLGSPQLAQYVHFVLTRFATYSSFGRLSHHCYGTRAIFFQYAWINLFWFFFSGIVSVIIDSNLHFSNMTKSVLPQEATPVIAQNRLSFSQCWFLGTGQLGTTNGQKAGELSHREMDMQCKKESMWFMNLLKKCLSKSL